MLKLWVSHRLGRPGDWDLAIGQWIVQLCVFSAPQNRLSKIDMRMEPEKTYENVWTAVDIPEGKS
jgi:hypothetical protein